MSEDGRRKSEDRCPKTGNTEETVETEKKITRCFFTILNSPSSFRQ